MNANVKLGRIFNVPFGLHWSWFIVFGLVTVSLAMGYFRLQDTGLAPTWVWILATATSLLFFASVLGHEFGHAIMAIRNQIPVRSIVLFVFGGVAHIGEEPRSAGAEFRIAIAGPLASFALAGLFWLIGTGFAKVSYLAVPAIWLAQVNLALAAFNMLPGFPLDGGRVFRAIIWAITHDVQKATRIASISGQLVAFGFIGYGIFTLFGGNLVNGFWLAFVGWFLQNAALSSRAQSKSQHALDAIKVSQVMSRDLESVPGKLTITQLIEEKFLPSGKHLFLIADDGLPRGLVSLHEVTSVPRKDWDATLIEQVMTPWERLTRIRADMGLASAMDAMEFAKVSLVPVVQDNQIAGLVTREQILRYLKPQ